MKKRLNKTMHSRRIRELEYRFIVPRAKLSFEPPSSISRFKLTSKKEILIEDILVERKEISLKSEDIGIRLRKLSDKIELTYKKFLGRFDGMAKFDEITAKIDEVTFDDFKKGEVNSAQLPILEKLQQKGELYPLLIITNRRKVYEFQDSDTLIEMVVEDIIYQFGEKRAQDAMIELEIKAGTQNQKEIVLFVNEIKTMYQAKESHEGKNSRAMSLLGIFI